MLMELEVLAMLRYRCKATTMRNMFCGFALIVTLVTVAHASELDLTPNQVFALDSPSVVVIHAIDAHGSYFAQGSGVVIAPSIVVSNCHVIEGAASAVVIYGKKHFPATLRYADKDRDLCAFTVTGLAAPPIRMGSTSLVKVGDSAYAIGAPEGLDLSLSGGLVSSLRHVPGGVVIQMTTPISPGSSGGGLFDSEGRLIGITSYYLKGGEQLNFALPIEWVNQLPQHPALAQAQTSPEPPSHTNATRDPLWRGTQAFLAGDFATALTLLDPLVRKGNPGAENVEGYMYLSGAGVHADLTRANILFEQAAAGGNADAQDNVGRMYEGGSGVPKDYSKAVYWFRQSAAQGDSDGENDLGRMYLGGTGVSQDYSQAFSLFHQAANAGNAAGEFNLGLIYHDGLGVTQNSTEAFTWFRKSAAQGFASAEYNLGLLYEFGDGVTQSYPKAVAWYTRAVNQNEDSAEAELGGLYFLGHGVSQDYERAAELFSEAVKQDNAQGEFDLGLMYDNGTGEPQDYEKAADLYRRAAQQGYAGAENNLGLMYDHGHGVAQDYNQAVIWFLKAAAQNDSDAIFNLGLCYAQGTGTPQDSVVAYALFNLAGSMPGSQQAQAAQNRDQAAETMTGDQVELGQELTRRMQSDGVLNVLRTYYKPGG